MKFASLATVLALFAGAGAVPVAAQTPTIGYVSANKIFSDTVEGRELAARLKTLQQEKALEIRKIQEALDATRRQLAEATDPATRTKLTQQEQQQRAEGERAAAQAPVELQKLQAQAQADLQNRVKGIIDEVAKSKNLQIVLNGDSAVVWSVPGIDITPVVIERLNAARAAAAPAKK